MGLVGLLGYGLMRSGLNRRLALRCGCEPSLTLPQTLLGVLLTTWVHGDRLGARGGAGAAGGGGDVLDFALQRRQALGAGWRRAADAGTVMRAMTLADPFRYRVEVEAVHLGVTALVLIGVTAVAAHGTAAPAPARSAHRTLARALEAQRDRHPRQADRPAQPPRDGRAAADRRPRAMRG